MAETKIISTKLSGYINAFKPGGKFENCCFSFTIPEQDLDYFEEQYQKALTWGANKLNNKRHEKALQKWDEQGLVKYSYGGPEQSAPLFPWVDAKGVPVDQSLDIREGTVVRLAIQTKPYVFGNKVGLALKVVGAQIIKAVTGSGSDSGPLDADEVANLFGEVEGFDQSDPSYQPHTEPEEFEPSEEDVPF